MICQQYQTHHNLTDAAMCRLLNDARPSPADPPVMEGRLKRLKEGKRPTKLENYLLPVATDDQCTSYN